MSWYISKRKVVIGVVVLFIILLSAGCKEQGIIITTNADQEYGEYRKHGQTYSIDVYSQPRTTTAEEAFAGLEKYAGKKQVELIRCQNFYTDETIEFSIGKARYFGRMPTYYKVLASTGELRSVSDWFNVDGVENSITEDIAKEKALEYVAYYRPDLQVDSIKVKEVTFIEHEDDDHEGRMEASYLIAMGIYHEDISWEQRISVAVNGDGEMHMISITPEIVGYEYMYTYDEAKKITLDYLYEQLLLDLSDEVTKIDMVNDEYEVYEFTYKVVSKDKDTQEDYMVELTQFPDGPHILYIKRIS